MGRFERPFSFPKIGRMPVDNIGPPVAMMRLAPIWAEKHETARRLAQRIKIVLDEARSKRDSLGGKNRCRDQGFEGPS